LAGVSDEELMEGLKNRDETALHEFRGRFGRIIRTIVDDMLVEENEADDVVQNTFSKSGNGRILLAAVRPASRLSHHSGAAPGDRSSAPPPILFYRRRISQ
jgi:hypothetical protein